MSASAVATPLTWESWFELNDQTAWSSDFGIYRIRITDTDGSAYCLNRLCGSDPEGIVYIGRSGFSDSKTDRSLGTRMKEFYSFGSHSGAWTYQQAKRVFETLGCYVGHRIFGSIIVLPGTKDAIVSAEQRAVRSYFESFGELPPFNSAFPGK